MTVIAVKVYCINIPTLSQKREQHMSGPYTIHWSNTLMGITWKRWGHGTGYNTQKGLSGMTIQPYENLTNTAEMSMDENILSNLAGGWVELYCGWYHETGCFSVRIYAPPQVAHMGDRPYYEVAYAEKPDSQPDWVKVVSDPSKPYQHDYQTDIGVIRLLVTPSSEHTSLTVNCVITLPN